MAGWDGGRPASATIFVWSGDARVLGELIDAAVRGAEVDPGVPAVVDPSPIHSIPHLPRWYRDRMIVIGDAAHAPTPTPSRRSPL